MAWTKPGPDLVERFHAALPDHPAAERRQMFGYPACFVNGNYFAGLHSDRMVVRLPDGLVDRFPVLADADGFDPMGGGKPLRDWYVIPPAVADDPDRLAAFLADALDEVVQLPPKAPKGKPSKG